MDIDIQEVTSCINSVPTSHFEVIPESGHSPYFERASLYNRVVDEFLQAGDALFTA